MSSTDVTSAQSSLDGYWYQLKVSVLFALDILADRQLTDKITLEPASEEDLETEIHDEPGALTQGIPIKTRKLVVQCKLRSTGPWTIGELASLLAHGKRRTPAKDQLKDPGVSYLLVTSADVNGVARELLTQSPTQWPKLGSLPKTLVKVLPDNASGRVAVWNNLDQERVKHRIDKILTTRFRVPQSMLASCIKQLEDGALIRMKGSEAGRWTREDVIAIIEKWDGCDGTMKELAGFVPPTNWNCLLTQLKLRHAIVLTGPSGTGKTTTAKALIASLREENPSLTPVPVKLGDGPERVRDDQTVGPVIYEIEDPWGKYHVESDSPRWNEQIHGFLASASPDRVFVITSRSDVMQDAELRSLDKQFEAKLLANHYRSCDRRKLFENRLGQLPRSEQSLVLQYAPTVVRELVLPLELDRFFSAAHARPEENENEASFMRRCIDTAKKQSIGSALISVVKVQKEWQSVAILWALIKVRERITFIVLDELECKLSTILPDLADHLSAFASTLVAGGNFQQDKSELSCADPRVEAGLEQAVLTKKILSARTLNHLLDALVTLNDVDKDWGAETATHIRAMLSSVTELQIKVSPATQEIIDDWLTRKLASLDSSFHDDLGLAAKAGSPVCEVAEVARWLDKIPISGQVIPISSWEEPEKSADWYEQHSRAPHTHAICDAFIRRVVTRYGWWFSGDFHEAIAKLSPNLTPSFCEALRATVAHGYNSSVETLINGAIADLDGYDPVFNEAAAYRQKEREARDGESLLALYNRNYDDEVREYHLESIGEKDDSASETICIYIDARRRRGEWKMFAGHPRLTGFLWEWIRVAHKSDKAPPPDELIALGQASFDGHYEGAYWEMVDRHFDKAVIPFLEDRLRTGSEADATRTSATTVALNHEPGLLIQLFSKSAGVRDDRLVELVLDVQASADDGESNKRETDVQVLIDTADDPVKAAISVLLSKSPPKIPDDVMSLLSAVPLEAPIGFSLAVGRILAKSGQDITDRLRCILVSTVDVTERNIQLVTDAMRLAADCQSDALVEIGLEHEFAKVRVEAMNGLFGKTVGPLPRTLLEMHTDPSSIVRARLVELLKERPDPSHIPTLMNLCRDTWTPDHHHQKTDASYPIAIEAIDVLRSESSLSHEVYKELVEYLKTSHNLDVRLRLLCAMVRHGTKQGQKKLIKMAVEEGRPTYQTYQRLTAQALFKESAHVSTDNLTLIADARICTVNPDVGLWLCMLFSKIASDDRVRQTAKALATNPNRRVLVILFYLFVSDTRSEVTQEEIASYLPGSVVSFLENINETGAEGDLSVLDELGDVQAVERVKTFLRNWFRKKDKIESA